MSPDPTSTRVLVTGAGGFIAGHCILQLLERCYRVRGTLRNMERAPQIRDVLTQHGQPGEELELCRADLLEDEGWREAVDGCDFVLHVASPIPPSRPKQEDALVPAARDGTLRVLRAAAAAGVKRVVLTSSLAAVCMGHDTPREGLHRGRLVAS